ncbi:MAG: hypothetical protein LBP43_07100, partial [Treponema sp.]|nr:hypothetical protein [Treponema sp.]
GVSVEYGKLTMRDNAEISNNSAANIGGGVFLLNSAFTMEGGVIKNNTNGTKGGAGGGIYAEVRSTVILKSGAEVSGNTAAGISVSNKSTLTLEAGCKITGNNLGDTNAGGAGGVYITDESTLIMLGGEITNNNAGMAGGGGVKLYWDSTFIMKGGRIAENIANGSGSYGTGGGVNLQAGSSFTMEGGVIEKNTGKYGGGLYIIDQTRTIRFTITGGTIYGSDAPDGRGNTAREANGGHALHYASYGGIPATVIDTTITKDNYPPQS